MPDYIPRVIQVLPLENYHLEAEFDDGKIVNFDVAPLLDDEEYAILKDENFFVRACTVVDGTVAWDPTGRRDGDECIELDPLMLHESPAINESFLYMGNTIIE